MHMCHIHVVVGCLEVWFEDETVDKRELAPQHAESPQYSPAASWPQYLDDLAILYSNGKHQPLPSPFRWFWWLMQ